MLTNLKVLIALVCVSFACAAQNDRGDVSVEQRQAIERTILDVHTKMREAAQQRDVDALYSYVLETDKCAIIENGRLRRTRQEALASTKLSMQRLKQLSHSYSQNHITVISPTTVLWVAEGTSSATLDDGRQFSLPFAETIVFVRKDGQWKVLHAHRSTPAER